jgi:hypothetical protein
MFQVCSLSRYNDSNLRDFMELVILGQILKSFGRITHNEQGFVQVWN